MECQAISYYHGDESNNCIQLHIGDRLTDVNELDECWCQGRNERTGQTGVFPKSSVTSQQDGVLSLSSK